MNSSNTMRIWIPVAQVALVALSACGGQEPTSEEYDDIAASVGAVVAEGPGSETEALRDTVEVAEGGVPTGMTREEQGTLVGRRGTLDYSFEVTCLDGEGVTQEICDETTDQATLAVEWTGEVDTARYDATVNRTGNWQLTGLLSTEAKLDGAGTFDVQSEFVALFRSEMRTYMFDYDAEYDGVMIRMSDRRPVAGTIRYTIHAARTASRRFRDIERELDVSAVVTFQGDEPARVELDGQRSYLVNLSNGAVQLAN